MIFHQPQNSLNNNFNAMLYTDKIWEPHFHKSLELVAVLQGTLHCSINDTDYYLNKGDFGLCLPYDIHSYRPQPNTQYWVCVFSEDYVHDFSKTARGKTGDFQFVCNAAVTRFASDALIHGSAPSRLAIKAALYAVCDEYSKSAHLSNKSQISENMALITDYVEQNHTRDIKLSDISALLGYDYHYVSRYFHSLFKMSFPEFLALHRLETAVALIEQGNKKIVEIALESGFQSVRSFNACFRSHFHLSPTEYQKTLLQH